MRYCFPGFPQKNSCWTMCVAVNKTHVQFVKPIKVDGAKQMKRM